MSIYGPGDVPSPHFLAGPISVLEVYKRWPGLVGKREVDELKRLGHVLADGSVKVVEVAVSTTTKPVPKRRKKR